MKSKHETNVRRNSTAALVLAVLFALTTRVGGAERQKLHGHLPEAVAKLGLQPVGRVSRTNQLHLAISLPLRNTNAMAQLLHDMDDPASPQFRQYLTPEQFTQKFGPTQDEYDAVRQFAEKYGLQVSASYPNRVVLDVVGQVSDIERAFQIRLNSYQHPTEARKFYAPDNEPSVDTGLAVLDISAMVKHPEIKQFSCSWGINNQGATADNLYQEMALQGQSFLVAKDYTDKR